MIDKSSAVGKASGAVQTAKAGARLRRLRKKRSWVASAALLAASLCGLVALGALTVKLLMAASSIGTQATMSPPGDRFRSASVVRESVDGERCLEGTFDNRTGSMADPGRNCSKPVVLDGDGHPIPEGTIRHLQGISKSFSNP